MIAAGSSARSLSISGRPTGRDGISDSAKMIDALIVFCALAALDFVWAYYTLAVTKKQSVLAASLASVIILLSGAAAIGYTSNHWMLLPAMAGAFVGTLAAIRLCPA
jgi:hypothetical protein